MNPPELPPDRSWTTVEFTDLRFAYSFLGTAAKRAGHRLADGFISWITAKMAGEGMGGRPQK